MYLGLMYTCPLRIADAITLSEPERWKLEKIVRSRSSAARLIERSRVALLASEGLKNIEIAEKLGSNVTKVGRWRKRFRDCRLSRDREGRLSPRLISRRQSRDCRKRYR